MKRHAKRVLSLFLAVMTLCFLFPGCRKITRDTPYTLRVRNDASGTRQWLVKLDGSGIVSYEMRDAEDNTTDVVFTGLDKGRVNVTLYLARTDERVQDADDVYVMTLQVDGFRNVSQPQPYYGAYSVRLNGDVTGAEWSVECSDEQFVHWTEDREYPKQSSDEDGMQEFTQIYTFTGRRPGATHVRILTSYPWAEGADNVREDFWLLVDNDYRVSRIEPTDFVSFRVSEQGSRAMREVYDAERTENGAKLSHYDMMNRWSDEKNDYIETRMNETVIDGGESLYMYLAGLLQMYGVPDWDGFSGSDSRVLDGTMFSFEAKLADGRTVSASGSNAYPDHYRDFWNSLSRATAAADSDTE